MALSVFRRTIGIDYSGARTPTSSLKGLRAYVSEEGAPPVEVGPAPLRKYLSRRGVAEWLVEQLAEGEPTIVGIDHGFSFPIRYFEAHGLAPDWPEFLDDFQRHWPTDEDHTYVDFVREGVVGAGAARQGNSRWRRLTEQRVGRAKSVFHFDFQGSVAKSTHSGLPWLRFIRRSLGARVHFWPFDGWDVPAGRSVIAEVYPALFNKLVSGQPTADQHDAWCIAAWLSAASASGDLATLLKPNLPPNEAALARVEGWILGAPAQPSPAELRARRRAPSRRIAGASPTRSTRDVILRADDLAAARAFYQGVLGLTLFMDEPHMLGLESGALRLFVERGAAHGPVLDFLVDDLEAAKTRLTAAGCRVVEEDPAIPRCYLTDPFGLTFNIEGRAG
jgi:predicted enzyme related to lactoylglutathione lyase